MYEDVVRATHRSQNSYYMYPVSCNIVICSRGTVITYIIYFMANERQQDTFEKVDKHERQEVGRRADIESRPLSIP